MNPEAASSVPESSYFNVIGRSMHCTLESITPYINIEDIKPEEK